MSEALRHSYAYDVRKVLEEYFDQIQFGDPQKRKGGSGSFIPIMYEGQIKGKEKFGFTVASTVYDDKLEGQESYDMNLRTARFSITKRKDNDDGSPNGYKCHIQAPPNNPITHLGTKLQEKLTLHLMENNKRFAPEEKHQNEQSRKSWDPRWFGFHVKDKELKSFLKYGCKDEEVVDFINLVIKPGKEREEHQMREGSDSTKFSDTISVIIRGPKDSFPDDKRWQAGTIEVYDPETGDVHELTSEDDLEPYIQPAWHPGTIEFDKKKGFDPIDHMVLNFFQIYYANGAFGLTVTAKKIQLRKKKEYDQERNYIDPESDLAKHLMERKNSGPGPNQNYQPHQKQEELDFDPYNAKDVVMDEKPKPNEKWDDFDDDDEKIIGKKRKRDESDDDGEEQKRVKMD